MPKEDAEALRLIEKAVLAIQARQHPGRPLFYAMDRLHAEVRKAQREAAASARA
jgi:hypothetical protein